MTWQGALLAILLATACAGNGTADAPPEPPLRIVAPNLEAPLAEVFPPGDALPKDPVKIAVFERINRDRLAEGLAPVLWDEAVSRVADAFCRNQIAENTTGHFLTDGIPPYARTALAGVFGMQYENSVTWKTTGSSFTDPVKDLALTGHEEMLAEKPPHDGHRKTILDPAATHVGVGYDVRGGNFRMAQEFLTRHLAWLKVERVSPRSAGVVISGKPIEGRRLFFVTVGWEPPPARLTREAASRRMSYSYPVPTEAFIKEGLRNVRIVGAVTSDRIRFQRDQAFEIRFSPERPGLWTLVFHTQPLREERPSSGGIAVLWVDRPGAAPPATGAP
ncbi:MAG TPA: CAP domain-containing protein [Thermoanaerobaculia bacterium]|nr:CAP domain-containing protein [Thermoanaerobaculia bacterium]